MITQKEIDEDYLNSVEAGKLLNITDARIRRLCLDGRFDGALKTGKSWIIPKNSVKNFQRLNPGKKSNKNFIKKFFAKNQDGDKNATLE